jgi:hypothetical protein
VTLNFTAPTGGQLVTLGSDSPNVVHVPPTVLVQAGQSLATFNAELVATEFTGSVMITAVVLGVKANAELNVAIIG